MTRSILAAVGTITILLSGPPAVAGEQTVTLAVDNLFCASCPYIVKQTLANVQGVRNVAVSYERKTAVVTFDDAHTSVAALTEATKSMGFPSRLLR
jgi:mercuric ion binding protein